MTAITEPSGPRGRVDLEVWVRRGCALIVASVAAYASYEHQGEFALDGGSDSTSAALWPLSVDGLLVLATVGVLKSGQQASRRGRIAVWLSFWLGIAVSLAANIAAAPTLAWPPVLVAGWPPVALLLAVELLAHGPRSRPQTETEQAVFEIEPTAPAVDRDCETETETGNEIGQVITLAKVAGHPADHGAGGRADRPRDHVGALPARAGPRTHPTGAELDRVAGHQQLRPDRAAAVARARPHPARRPRPADARGYGMTSQLPAIPAGPADTTHPRRALARLALSSAYREAADFAAGGVPTVSDEFGDPYDFVDHAARLVAMAQDALARAVVYARERGGRWGDIADALDITAEQARDCYTSVVDRWVDALDRPWERSSRFLASRMPEGTTEPDQAAAELDQWCVRHLEENSGARHNARTTASKTAWSRPTCPSTPRLPR